MPSTDNPMRDQIIATPAGLKAGFEHFERDARLAVPTPLVYRTRRIILIGSGDSYFAAKAAELALMAHSGIPVEVRTPLEAGRYHAAYSSAPDMENTLVVAISNSGGAARVCEAATLYRQAGATVLALTKAPQGRLARICDHVLIAPVPGLPSAPGYGPYLFAFVGLLLLGIRFGEVRMNILMDDAQALRGRLADHFDDLETLTAAMDVPVAALAESMSKASLFEFVGGGPNLAVAEYGAAKLLEAAGRHALARDVEEWTHLNYFDRAPGEIATLMIDPQGSRSASRNEEVRTYMRRLGRHLAVVGTGEDMPPLPEISELWSPLFTSLPVALFAARMAALDGEDYGRGSKGAWSGSADASTVQKSAMFEAQP